MDYLLLEKIQMENKKKICIFGAGRIGKTWAYDLLTCAGFSIDCYCDNKIGAGREIIAGIKTVDFHTLCEVKEQYLVFIAVNEKVQDEIRIQLEENGITNSIIMGFLFLQEFCESVLSSQDVEVIEYELNLENPKTYNAKLQWLKLYDRNPMYTKMVDKYEFKKFITQTLGEEYVIPTLGVWDSMEEIEWDKLPEQFVLKCTHDSGSVIVCKDKNEFDVNNACKILRKHLKRNYFWVAREWPYRDVKPRIMAEEYMEEEGELKDYKFFTFNGKVELLYVASDRMNTTVDTKFDYFDRTYKPLGIRQEHPNAEVFPWKPLKFDLMIDIVEKLSKNINHVRVDLYEAAGKIYVGEMTFYHLAGLIKFEPVEWDYKLGELITLSK